VFFDKSNRLRKFISRHGNYLTLIGGIFLILIGILQVTGLWADAMNSIRGYISDFAPVI
jgi:cytochrome c-type biogenesis protein